MIGATSLPSSSSFGGYTTFLCRLRADGTIAWTKLLNISPAFPWSKILCDSDGGYFCVGSSGKGIDFSYYMIVVKFDSTGNFIWSRIADHYLYSWASDAITTSDGGYLTVGTYQPQIGHVDQPFIVKFDRSGTLQWGETLKDVLASDAYGVVELRNGNYIVVGGTNYGFGRSTIIKLSNSGTILWYKKIQLELGSYIRSVAETTNGELAIAGSTTDSVTKIKKVFAATMDSDGNVLWQTSYNSPDPQDPKKILGFTNGDLALICSAEHPVPNQTGGIDTLTETGIIRFDRNGVLQDAVLTNVDGLENYPHDASIDTANIILVSGSLKSKDDNNTDGFLLQYDPKLRNCYTIGSIGVPASGYTLFELSLSASSVSPLTLNAAIFDSTVETLSGDLCQYNSTRQPDGHPEIAVSSSFDPLTGAYRISCPESITGIIEIYDVLGRKIGSIPGTNLWLWTPSSKGLYIITISGTDNNGHHYAQHLTILAK